MKDAIRLRPDAAAVLCVDMQERLAAAMQPEAFAEAEKNAVRLLRGARVLGVPIFTTEQYPRGLGHSTPAVRDAFGDAPVFEKVHFSAFDAEDLAAAIRESGRSQLLICGMETHICVLQTALGALDNGLDSQVVADACLSRTAANKAVGLELARSAGALVTSVETALFALLGKAGGAEFKEISRLIR